MRTAWKMAKRIAVSYHKAGRYYHFLPFRWCWMDYGTMSQIRQFQQKNSKLQQFLSGVWYCWRYHLPPPFENNKHLKRGAFFIFRGLREITAKAVKGMKCRGVETSGSTARSDEREDFAFSKTARQSISLPPLEKQAPSRGGFFMCALR